MWKTARVLGFPEGCDEKESRPSLEERAALRAKKKRKKKAGHGVPCPYEDS